MTTAREWIGDPDEWEEEFGALPMKMAAAITAVLDLVSLAERPGLRTGYPTVTTTALRAAIDAELGTTS